MDAAVHELGHITVFGLAGISMGKVQVQRRLFTRLGSEGAVWTDNPLWDDPTQVEAFLMGLVSGMEAHRLWLILEHHWDPKKAGAFAHLGGGGDRPMFHAYAQGWMSISTAHSRAQELVTAHWPRIMRGAPVLRRYKEMKVRKLVKR
jgi:hypothetical protein